MKSITIIQEEANCHICGSKKLTGCDHYERLLPFTKSKPFAVMLSNCGNPDHGQNPDVRVYGTTVGWCMVESIEQAVKVCMLYCEMYNLGGSNWTGGQLINADHVQFANISYNGRVWAGTEQKAIFNP